MKFMIHTTGYVYISLDRRRNEGILDEFKVDPVENKLY
jgi:hypothetical protein